MLSINLKMLQIVASGLEELKADMVFVGGAVAELYVADPAASDIRPTVDIDCVIELKSRSAHVCLEENLRKKQFTNDTTSGAPICRWVYRDIKVDVMPADEAILGFSNRWYSEGIENRITKFLPDGNEIYIFPPAYYLAAKLEAHKNRGGNDLRQSHDFEDIIYILNNCSNIFEEIVNSSDCLKYYLKDECQKLLNNTILIEGIECALPYGAGDESTEIIVGMLQNIAEIS